MKTVFKCTVLRGRRNKTFTLCEHVSKHQTFYEKVGFFLAVSRWVSGFYGVVIKHFLPTYGEGGDRPPPSTTINFGTLMGKWAMSIYKVIFKIQVLKIGISDSIQVLKNMVIVSSVYSTDQNLLDWRSEEVNFILKQDTLPQKRNCLFMTLRLNAEKNGFLLNNGTAREGPIYLGRIKVLSLTPYPGPKN